MKEILKWIALAILLMICGVLTYQIGYDGRYGVSVTKSASLLLIFLAFFCGATDPGKDIHIHQQPANQPAQAPELAHR